MNCTDKNLQHNFIIYRMALDKDVMICTGCGETRVLQYPGENPPIEPIKGY